MRSSLVLQIIVGLFWTCLSTAAAAQPSPRSNAYPQEFVGIWRSPDEHNSLFLNLHEEGVQLAGTLQSQDCYGAAPTAASAAQQTVPVRLQNVKISGPYLRFACADQKGTAVQWQMEVTTPGRARLQRTDSAEAKAIPIARETIYGLTKAPAAADSAVMSADLRQFAGEWKTEYQGHPFITLMLREQAGHLAGSCRHSRSINWDKHGALTVVSEEFSEDEVVSASASGKVLSLVIANAEDADDPVKINLTLTGPAAAEGALVDLPADAPKPKPWLFLQSSK